MGSETLVADLCRTLKLPTVGAEAARLAAEAGRQGTGHLDFLFQLLLSEVAGRDRRRAARRIKEAGFPVVKTLEGFDFRRNLELPEALIRQLASGDFIDRAESVILIGEPGTGKTHLAIALGMAAAEHGRAVRFVSAARLANELVESRDARELSKVVARYARVELLIVDELGYIPLSKIDAELLFQVLAERQERRPLIVTTNLAFGEWTSIFPDPRLCKAVLDRLTHRAHIIDTGKNSIRLEEALSRLESGVRKEVMAETEK